jgi:hypothetical protein
VQRIQGRLYVGIATLLWLMPFHAFLTVWLGSLIGYRQIIQSWKELLLLMLAFFLLVHWRKLQLGITEYLIGGFAGLSLVLGLVLQSSPLALALGLKVNLGFLLAFIIAKTTASLDRLNRASAIIIVTSAVVAGFGLLQVLILPRDWLSQFGYGAGTIEPFRMVDPAIPAVRILSTLGGPNQFGSFLILPLCLVLALTLRRWRWWQPPLLALLAFSLFHTYSRSAWIGATVGLIITLLASLNRRRLAAATLALCLLAAGGGLALPKLLNTNSSLQYYLLHSAAAQHSQRGSDAERLQSQSLAWQQAVRNPLGSGTGNAGPASQFAARPLISENYYLQIAIETGLIGLAIFLAICLRVGGGLWAQRRSHPAIAALLGSLAGLSLVNLFLHGWADSSTALVWWSLAGLALGCYNPLWRSHVAAN